MLYERFINRIEYDAQVFRFEVLFEYLMDTPAAWLGVWLTLPGLRGVLRLFLSKLREIFKNILIHFKRAEKTTLLQLFFFSCFPFEVFISSFFPFQVSRIYFTFLAPLLKLFSAVSCLSNCLAHLSTFSVINFPTLAPALRGAAGKKLPWRLKIENSWQNNQSNINGNNNSNNNKLTRHVPMLLTKCLVTIKAPKKESFS